MYLVCAMLRILLCLSFLVYVFPFVQVNLNSSANSFAWFIWFAEKRFTKNHAIRWYWIENNFASTNGSNNNKTIKKNPFCNFIYWIRFLFVFEFALRSRLQHDVFQIVMRNAFESLCIFCCYYFPLYHR